jgi:outer membrane lipoprotein SlyB
MNARRATATILAAVLSTSCAINPQATRSYSLIDPAGVDMQRYEQDYAECAALANQTDTAGRAAGAGAGAAVFGAILGALLGAAIGGRGSAGYGAGIGAAYGVGSGVGAGIASGEAEKAAVLRRCLTGRGYAVIR